MRSRLRSVVGLLATTVLLPLVVLALGLWEWQRGADDWADLDAEWLRITRMVETFEARTPPDRRVDYRMQFHRGGQTYAGPLALEQARAARNEAETLTAVMRARQWLPPVVTGAAGLAAVLSALVLLAGAALGQLGRRSREALVRGFALMRSVLPATLALQVVLATMAFVSAVLFEAGALAQFDLGSGEFKMLLIAGVAVLGSLYAAGTALAGLRGALRAFEPDPLPILGRPVSPAEAPGLWRLVEGLAERLNALTPHAVVVGLTEGFYVSAGAKVLEPGGASLSGRTLYVPLPYLPFLRADELAAIIGHELAHFAGDDTAYSLRFLPIYAGVGRSLDAVSSGAGGDYALGLLSAAVRLGLFVMERFHHAVRHWSRAREFAADAAGAGPASPEAAVRALLHIGAVQPRVAETLNEASEHPDAASEDLVAAVLERARIRGLDDPSVHLEAEQPHPTDTHPPTRERVARLGFSLTPDLLSAAASVPPLEALGTLSMYFADPVGLCRAATGDFLAAVRRRDEAVRTHLAVTAAEVGTETRVLRENTRPGAIALALAGASFCAAAAALAVLGLPGVSLDQARLVAGVTAAGGVLFAGVGALWLRRGERAFLILHPEALIVPGLDPVISWETIADLDMTWRQTRMISRLLLPPDAPFPVRASGPCWAKLDTRRRIVTITAGLPRGMKPQDFADLIARYRQAAEARKILAAQEAATARHAHDAAPV